MSAGREQGTQTARAFLDAMVAEGLDLPGDQPWTAGYVAAVRFARERAEEIDGYQVATFARGAFVEQGGHIGWFPGVTDAVAAAREFAAQRFAWEQALLKATPEPPASVVDSFFVRFRTLSNGTVELAFSWEDPALEAAFDRAPEVFAYERVPRWNEQQARALAGQLRRRLKGELRQVLRPVQGGLRRYRKAARLTQHGLTPERLAKFALRCQVLIALGGSVTGSREIASKELKIPSGYGGKAREDALRRLERLGREILDRQPSPDKSSQLSPSDDFSEEVLS